MLRKYYSEDTFFVQDIIENPERYNTLLDTYSDGVYKYVLRVLAFDQLLAEQVIQDLFLRIFKNLRTYDSKISLRCWIYQYAYGVLKENIQREKHGYSSTGTQITNRLDNTDLDQFTTDDIDLLLSHLSPLNRHLLVLDRIQHFTHIEIAVIMKMSEREIASHMITLENSLKQLVHYG